MNRMNTLRSQLNLARKLWGELSEQAAGMLKNLILEHGLSIASGDLIYIDHRWYVTHSGLLRLARRKRCAGISVRLIREACNPASSKWAFRATVYTGVACRGFSGYGDATPFNVSPQFHGAEMRLAETRAVTRALRKAYGIGVCSVEEIGSFERPATPDHPLRKLAREFSGNNGHNGNGSRVRDRLCQIIRQHKLDAELVKSYAVDFCGTKTLREASREQVENFVIHLADYATKDRNALLCQLNSYTQQKAGAA